MIIDKKLINSLPVFLALPCAQFNQETDYRIRLDAMFNIAELAVRFEVALLLSDLKPENSTITDSIKSGIERPSFGKWIEFFRDLSKHSKCQKHYEESKKLLENLCRLRNEKAHSANFSAEKAKKAIDKLWSIFLRLLKGFVNRKLELYADNIIISGIDIDPKIINQDKSSGFITLGGIGEYRKSLKPLLRWYRNDHKRIVTLCYASSKRKGNKKQQLQLIYDGFDPEIDSGQHSIDDSQIQFSQYFNINPPGSIAFARNQYDKFIPPENNEINKWLDDKKNERILVLTGSPGSGKSALLAFAAIEKSKEQSNKVIYHRFAPGTDWFSWEAFQRSCFEQLDISKDVLDHEMISDDTIVFLDGLDLIEQGESDTYQTIHDLIKQKGRWVLTSPEQSNLHSGLPSHQKIIPPKLDGLSIRAILTNLRRDIADKIFRQDRDSLHDDKVINPFIEKVSSLSAGNPLWIQLLCEDLENGRLNPYDQQKLPDGLAGYAENSQIDLHTQHKSNRILNRLSILLNTKRKENLSWLDECENAYDDLLNTPLEKRFGVLAQPIWSMDSLPPLSSNEDELLVEQPTVISDEGNAAFDILAWYSPLHFDGQARYGIYLPSEGIVHLADELKRSLPDNGWLDQRLAIYWAAHILYLHELGHAFIERLVFAMEKPGENAFYEVASEKYAGLILMEEALCNTFVCAMHQTVLAEMKDDFASLSKHKDELHQVLIKFMRQQPRGYRDFIEIKVEPQRSYFFIESCKALLKFAYGIDVSQQDKGIEKVLSDVEALIWKEGFKELDNLEFYTLVEESTELVQSDLPFSQMKQRLFPWKTPIYFLGLPAESNDSNQCPPKIIQNTSKPWRIDLFRHSSVLDGAQLLYKRDDGRMFFHIMPAQINGSLLICGTEMTDFEGLPEIINGDFYCRDNKLTSFSEIHHSIKEIHGIADFTGNHIKSHVLGLFKIDGLTGVRLTTDSENETELKKVENIINEHLSDGDILSCQEELIDAGLKTYAQL